MGNAWCAALRQVPVTAYLLAGMLILMGQHMMMTCTWAQELPVPAATAKSYCASPEARSLKCGWASEGEQDKSAPGVCIWCGTFWAAEPDLNLNPPEKFNFTGAPYNQAAGHVISLGCNGPVVVRAVIHYIKQSPDETGNCSWARLVPDRIEGGSRPPMIRCTLELPPGPEPEYKRALRAKESNCYVCTYCDEGGGCPNRPGTWYADSYVTHVSGCASNNFTAGYTPNTPAIEINPNTIIQLAKFEVCSNPGCFDAGYEAQKARTAKKCAGSKCP